MHRRLAGLAGIAVVAAALAGCAGTSGSGSTASGGSLTTLKIATIGLLSDGSLKLGEDHGFFKAEGLQLETTVVANPPAGIAAAQSGQVDLAYAPTIPVLNALSQSVPLKIVAAADGYPDDALQSADPEALDDNGLYVGPGSSITDVSQLAGKTIAVPARKAQLEVTISALLSSKGVKPSSVNWVVLDFASAVAALKSHSVDAAGLVSPFTSQAVADGGKRLAAPGVHFFEKGAVGVWVTGGSTASGKSKAIAAFARAMSKTAAYANDHSEEAIKDGLALTKSTLTVDQVTKPYWPTEVRTADVQRVDDKLVELGFLPKKVDLSNAFFTGSGS